MPVVSTRSTLTVAEGGAGWWSRGPVALRHPASETLRTEQLPHPRAPGGRAPRREQPARPRERRVGPVLPALVPGRHGDRQRCQDGQAGRSFLQGLPFRANRGLEVTRELPDSKDATGPAKAPLEARGAAPRSGETAPGETVGCRILRIKRRPVLARDPGLYRKRRGGSDRRLGSILRGWLVFEQRAEAATTSAVGVFGDDGAF